MLKQLAARITAIAIASATVLAQAPASVAARVRVTHDGERVSGRLMAVDNDAWTLVPDGKQDHVRIPLPSISVAEVSEGKRSRVVADVTGIAVGYGAFAATAASTCDFGSSGGCPAVAFLVGAASGIAIAHLIGRERWRQLPLASLANVTPPATRR